MTFWQFFRDFFGLFASREVTGEGKVHIVNEFKVPFWASQSTEKVFSAGG